jgi:hypothetical protein
VTEVNGYNYNGAGVVGMASVGTGVIGCAGFPYEEGIEGVNLFIPPGYNDTVGVYGCVVHNDNFTLEPTPINGENCGVWGDIPSSDATGIGVLGSHSGNGSGVLGVNRQAGVGVFGESESGRRGKFVSVSGPQLQLVPSATPLAETQNPSLLETGQVGDLYLFSVGGEVGTTGTYNYTTILWLCIAPPVPGSQAVWAQVPLGDTVGG